MSAVTKASYYLIILVSVVVITASLLSLSVNNTLWWMKTLDFPRLQYLVAAFLCLAIFTVLTRKWTFWPVALVVGLLATLGIQATFIYPYTSLAEQEVTSADVTEDTDRIRLVIANVYMHNRQADALQNVVAASDPDLLLLMEVDSWWIDHVPQLRERYPHYHELPIGNTYGMALYSRYPLANFDTMFLQHDSVPSFRSDIQLPSGRSFLFYGVHPVPPVISKYPDNEGQKEKELVMIGQRIKGHDGPVVVAGDFNDVAWSNTSRLFQVSGKLGDTRVGRGLYNSFDAQSYVLRWPLDHIYVSEEFRVIDLQRLGKFGSDHFPVYIELALTQ